MTTNDGKQIGKLTDEDLDSVQGRGRGHTPVPGTDKDGNPIPIPKDDPTPKLPDMPGTEPDAPTGDTQTPPGPGGPHRV